MSHLVTKGWVCLVDDAKLAALRESWRRSSAYGFVREPLWRQVSVTAAANGIEVRLLNVDEEAATGGYWNSGNSGRKFKLTWVDLNDLDSLPVFFANEMLATYRLFDKLVQPLRDDMAALRRVLAA